MRLAASGRGLRRLQPRQRLRACAPLLRPQPCCGHRSSSSSAAAADGEEGTAFAVDEHFPPELAGFSSQEQYRAVVKVFNVHSTPNYLMPWTNKPHRDSTGSGFCIEGRRIITNAHVVADTTHCQVRKHGEAIKFTARVVGISHECDLAMLAVEDDAFWAEVAPLPLGDIPELQDGVTVVGYPTGGDNISVTGGVVSRVDFQQYAHGAANLLAVQIDAAINPGNSGVSAKPSWPFSPGSSKNGAAQGPAMLNGEVAGVAFQNLIGAENIGFIIPTSVVRHFLDDIAQRGVCAFPTLGVLCQPLDSPSLRTFLGLDRFPEYEGAGVLVNKVLPTSSADPALQQRDVLLRFNGEMIGCDGTVHFRGEERTSFDWLVTGGKVGDTCELTVLRSGEEVEVRTVLKEGQPLVPVHNYDRLPSYFIVAGLVFNNLTQPYLHEYGDDWYNTSPRRLCTRALHGVRKAEGDEVVVLTQVLAHTVNNGATPYPITPWLVRQAQTGLGGAAGYQGYHDLEVRRVNGERVENLRHMKTLVECSKDSHWIEHAATTRFFASARG